MTGDPYYLPTESELIILANMNGVKQSKIAEYVNKSQPAVNRIIKTKGQNFVSYPKMSVKDAQEIKSFFEALDLLKKAGL